jgi:hypothetical protein
MPGSPPIDQVTSASHSAWTAEPDERFIAVAQTSTSPFGDSAMLIGGELAASTSGEWLDSVEPATEEILGRSPAGTAQDVDAAVVAAARAREPSRSQPRRLTGRHKLKRHKAATLKSTAALGSTVKLEVKSDYTWKVVKRRHSSRKTGEFTIRVVACRTLISRVVVGPLASKPFVVRRLVTAGSWAH